MAMKPVIVLVVFFSLSGWGWAQESGQQPGGGGGNDQSTPSQDTQHSSRKRPIFLAGKVMLDDGQTPTQPVRVELVCQGSVVRHDYATGNGVFSIEINTGGRDLMQPMDASVSSTPVSGMGISSGLGGNNDLSGGSVITDRYDSLNLSSCEIQAQLAGYLSDRIPLGQRRAFDDPDVGVIMLRRTDGRQGGTVSLKTLTAPKDARKAYEKAGQELSKEKVDLKRAAKELEKAVEIYPEFASAWYMLGQVRREMKDTATAREAFSKAMSADADYLNPMLGMALLAIEANQWEEASQLTARALEINFQNIQAHYYNALASSSLGQLEVAEQSARQVLESREADDYPLSHYVMGYVLAEKGDFQAAAAEYRTLVDLQPEARLSQRLQQQLVEWESRGLLSPPED